MQVKELGPLKITRKKVIFSDESEIVIGKDCRIYIWGRWKNRGCQTAFLLELVKKCHGLGMYYVS